MAIAIDDLNTFCRTYVLPKVVDNITRTGPLVFKLLEKPRKFVGPYYEVPVTYAKNANAEFYTASASLTTTVRAPFTKAQYSPIRANTAITLEGLDMALNQGEAKVLDMVKENVKLAEASMKELFSTDLYNTTQSNAFYGLHTIAAAGTTTFGGISNGDASTWCSSSGYAGASGGPDSTTTSLTKEALDKHYNSGIYGNEQPNFGTTTYDIWAGISAVHIAPYARYTDPKMAQLGFENIKYRNAVLAPDPQCGSGDLWFFNTDRLYFAVVPGYNFKFIDFEYPTNKDQATAHIRWYGQLICESRRQVAWMSAISGVA